MSRDDHTAMAA